MDSRGSSASLKLQAVVEKCPGTSIIYQPYMSSKTGIHLPRAHPNHGGGSLDELARVNRTVVEAYFTQINLAEDTDSVKSRIFIKHTMYS